MLCLQSVSRQTSVDSEPALSDKQLWRFLAKGGGKETARRAHRGDSHIPALDRKPYDVHQVEIYGFG